jgi:hypothetical protein
VHQLNYKAGATRDHSWEPWEGTMGGVDGIKRGITQELPNNSVLEQERSRMWSTEVVSHQEDLAPHPEGFTMD